MGEETEPQGKGTQSGDVSRRVVLRTAAVGGVALPLLVACGADDGTSGPSGSGSTSEEPSAADTPSESGAASGLVSTAEVPVGGGVVLADQKIVVTQPTEGDFKAFTAVCTHQGCTVNSVSDGQINCPCHGSAFSVEDGSVVNGPAEAPLDTIPVSVQDDQVVQG